jgi:uncharacterized protein YndB with AHSA1/START domain
MAKVPSVEQTFYIAVPPKRVFAALTQPKQLTRWFVEKAEIQLREGGEFRLSWGRGAEMKGKVKAYTAPSKLVVAWHDKMQGGKAFDTVARFRIRKKGRGTSLTVTHEGFRNGKSWIWLYGAIQSGWAYYLLNLKSVLEHGTDLRSASDRL